MMNLNVVISIFLPAALYLGSQVYGMNLVKISPEFKRTYIKAYTSIDSVQYTPEMTYLYTGLNYGGSILYCDVVEAGIQGCVKALSKDSARQEMIRSLQEFRQQINSDEVYDPQTSAVYKRVPLKSGKTRLFKVPYDPNKCYKIYSGVHQDNVEYE